VFYIPDSIAEKHAKCISKTITAYLTECMKKDLHTKDGVLLFQKDYLARYKPEGNLFKAVKFDVSDKAYQNVNLADLQNVELAADELCLMERSLGVQLLKLTKLSKSLSESEHEEASLGTFLESLDDGLKQFSLNTDALEASVEDEDKQSVSTDPAVKEFVEDFGKGGFKKGNLERFFKNFGKKAFYEEVKKQVGVRVKEVEKATTDVNLAIKKILDDPKNKEPIEQYRMLAYKLIAAQAMQQVPIKKIAIATSKSSMILFGVK